MEVPFKIFIGFVLIRSVQCKIEVTHFPKGFDLQIEWEIISKFMQDQYTVTLFVEQNCDEYGDKLFKFSVKDYRFGIFRYNNLTLLSQFWASLQNVAVFTNKIYGAVIIMRDQRLLDFVVKSSTNNKLVLVFFDQGLDSIKNVMRNMWNHYKHFQLITLSIHETNGNRIIQHNPFESKFFEYPIKDVESSTNFALYLDEQFRSYLHNMAGYEIRVFIFDFPLVSELKRNETGHIIGYDGVDGGIVKMSKQFMNYTPIFVAGPTLHSTNLSGISTTRSIIDQGIAEVGLNGRFIVDTPYNNIVYMYPLDTVALKFLVPINYEVAPLVILAYYCFDAPSQSIISFNLILLTAIWSFGIWIIKENAESATVAIPLRVLGIFYGVAMKVPKKLFNKIIFVTIAMFGLLLNSIYQGTVVQQLNNQLKPYQLNSLNDLLHSNLNIIILTYLNRSTKNHSQNEEKYFTLMGDIGRKPIIEYDSIYDGLDMVAYNKTSALLIPTLFYAPFNTQYFNRTTGLDLLHMIEEPVTSTFVTYVIGRNSPYVRVFSYVTRIYVESGIMLNELNKASYTQHLSSIRRIKTGYIPKEKNRFRAITLEDVVRMKYFLITSVTISVFVFILELVVHFVHDHKSK